MRILILVAIPLVIWLSTFGWQSSKFSLKNLDEKKIATAQHLKETVKVISSDIGNRSYADYNNLKKTAEYIKNGFLALGYKTRILSYEIDKVRFDNIIAEREGHPESDEIVIIGAHYDSCSNPGADDNASGIAALMELAALLKDEPLKRKLKFIAFTNEEPPFFTTERMGSRVYTKEAKKQGEQIKGAVILEMLGYYSEKPNSQHYLPFLGPFYPNRANFVTIVGNFPSTKLVGQLISYFRKVTDFPVAGLISPSFIPGVYFSDHWSFWKERYPAVMITDTAYLRSPHYHQSTDLPDTLDYERMAFVIQGLKEAIVKFVNE